MAEIIEKMAPRKFVDKFCDLMVNQNIHNILIRGYFDDDKVLLAFGILNDLPNYQNGTLVIGNTRVQDEKRFLEQALRKPLPRFNLKDIFKINGLNIQFTQWKKHRDFRFNDNKDFAIFHPVQTVISDISELDKFRKVLTNSKARKNILITTNDFNNNPEKIYDIVDAVLILDTKASNEENKQTYDTIKANLAADGKEEPYWVCSKFCWLFLDHAAKIKVGYLYLALEY